MALSCLRADVKITSDLRDAPTVALPGGAHDCALPELSQETSAPSELVSVERCYSDGFSDNHGLHRDKLGGGPSTEGRFELLSA
jgi:hypothetical protein